MPTQATLTIQTDGPGLVEVTASVSEVVERLVPTDVALCTLFLRHTSASLLIQENADPDVRRDLEHWLTQLVPHADTPAMGWISHRMEGPDDMPAHIKAAHLPVSLSIPVAQGRLCLGTWQGIYLWEHRDRPHRRDIVVHIA
ncbi:MAG: secondary thiamine-phosphate synthase enzyme YjbQ [Pseudomonadota bacterium]